MPKGYTPHTASLKGERYGLCSIDNIAPYRSILHNTAHTSSLLLGVMSVTLSSNLDSALLSASLIDI
jgi:hypothetical protein